MLRKNQKLCKQVGFLQDGHISRHTIVCRAAQEAGAPHREYINRKKENAIFTQFHNFSIVYSLQIPSNFYGSHILNFEQIGACRHCMALS